MTEKVTQIVELVKSLTVVELAEVVKALETEFGVSAAAAIVAGPATGEAEESTATKDTVNVELTEIGQQKIAVIKVVKEKLGLGLKEAKDLVEKAPVVVKENVKMEEAEALKAELEANGAKVTLK